MGADTAKSTIAAACGALLAKGVPSGEVLKLEARLRAIVDGGMSCVVELPEHGLSVTLPPPRGARRKHLQRPVQVTR